MESIVKILVIVLCYEFSFGQLILLNLGDDERPVFEEGDDECGFPDPIDHAMWEMDGNNGYFTCEDGYKFSNDVERLKLECIDGYWDGKPDEVTCIRDLGNCYEYPIVKKTIGTKCSTLSCTLTCRKNYIFRHGDKTVQFSCKKGEWLPKLIDNMTVQCVPECHNGMVYQDCGQKLTCSNPDRQEELCHSGCYCPNGTLELNGKCVRKHECPCIHDGQTYDANSEIKKQCNTCKCMDGNWKCTENDCSRRCTVFGDPHYATFDGQRFDFMGLCSYYLMKTDLNLDIIGKNGDCWFAGMPVQCLSSVEIWIRNNNNNWRNKIIIQYDHKITVNGIDRTFDVPFKVFNERVSFDYASSNTLRIEVADGPTLQMIQNNNYQFYIDAPASFSNRTNGLCGNFDFDRNNEYLTPEDTVAGGPTMFADSWRVKEICDPSVEPLELPHPCESHPERAAKAKTLCDKLYGSVFQDCSIDEEKYYEECTFDICAGKGDPRPRMCSAFETYASACSRQKTPINWRNQILECAITCPPGQVYEECSDRCYLNCVDMQTMKTNCTSECVPGCRCPRGQALDEYGRCISIYDCPCRFQDINYRKGYQEHRRNNDQWQLCKCEGAEWDCVDTPEPSEPIQPFNKMQNCSEQHMNAVPCPPDEPKTCGNMHSYSPKWSSNECKASCRCKSAFVLDENIDECVLPQKCTCEFNGQFYSHLAHISESDQDCICESSHWYCLKKSKII